MRDNEYNMPVLQAPFHPAHQSASGADPLDERLRRTLRTRVSELEAAERHIARLEEKNLALKEAQRDLKQLRKEHRVLRTSTEGLVARALLTPRRLLGKLRRNGRAAESSSDVPPAARDYQAWFGRHRATAGQLDAMRQELHEFSHRPFVTIITPVFNTRPDWLREAVESVRAQIYENWELFLIDDASTAEETKRALRDLADRDPRIRVFSLEEHGGIAAASNRGITETQREWIALLDHDDLLEPDALFHLVKVLQTQPEADIVYSDEDKLTEHGLEAPSLKPEWSPDFFLSYNYISHFTMLRRARVEEARGFQLGFDGAQDYDLFLRIIERTKRIQHVPRVLYHWRRTETSTSNSIRHKPGALEAGKRALSGHLARSEVTGHVAIDWRTHAYWVRRDLNFAQRIVIVREGCGSEPDRLSPQTEYANYEIASADSIAPGELNRLIKRNDCPWVLFLGADLEPINRDWLELMAEHIQRAEIGAVGPRVLAHDNTIDHAGIVLNQETIAQMAFCGLPAEHPGVCRQLQITRNYSAVSASCLLTRRDLFLQVGGFDEQVGSFSDVDYCLKLRRAGYEIVYTPFAILRRDVPGKSIPVDTTALAVMRARWSDWLGSDPCYNPLLSRRHADFSLGD
ncbi:MAG: glycosyltransferase [Chthoniobacterales bacterium]